MKTTAKRLIASVLLVICNSGLSQQISDAHTAFNIAYSEWREHLSTNIPPDIMVRSFIPAGLFYDNEPFRKILALGVPALPDLMKKCHEDRWLLEAVQRITKFEYHVIRTGDKPQTYTWTVEDFPHFQQKGGPPDRVAVWDYWWTLGRHKTGERFAELHGKFKALKSQKQETDAAGTRDKIMNLGIAALPFLTAKAEENPEFISVISKLTNGEMLPTATPAECKQWWEKHKAKWILPAQ